MASVVDDAHDAKSRTIDRRSARYTLSTQPPTNIAHMSLTLPIALLRYLDDRIVRHAITEQISQLRQDALVDIAIVGWP